MHNTPALSLFAAKGPLLFHLLRMKGEKPAGEDDELRLIILLEFERREKKKKDIHSEQAN